jgi:hypothetical protein
MFPNFPALKDFLSSWETTLDGPLFAVSVAHSKLIKPAELQAVDGVFRLHSFNWSSYGGSAPEHILTARRLRCAVPEE